MDQKWTLVTRRKRHHNPPPSQTQSQTLTLTLTLNPTPFTPTGFSNPLQESKLLLQIQSAINQLSNSHLLPRFLSRQIRQHLDNLLLSSPRIQIVAFGVGSIQSHQPPRLQLALALLLKQALGAQSPDPIEVFDPVFSVVECNVLAALGCRVVGVNEFGRRAAAGATVFYMPHCEAGLYDNVLAANWEAARLRGMAVVGNSFGAYARNVREMRGVVGCVDLERDGRHLVAARGFVKEVGFEVEEGGFEFDMAFHDMSWHFFEVDDDAELGVV